MKSGYRCLNFSDPFGLCPGVLQGGLASLRCAIKEIWGGIKSGPRELRGMGRVALTDPIASAAVMGPLGEVGAAARVAGPAARAGRIVIGETAG